MGRRPNAGFARRVGMRGIGGGARLQAHAVGDFVNGTTHYKTATGGGIAGTATGFSVAVLAYLDALGGSGVRTLFARGRNGTSGWSIYDSSDQLRFRCGNGAAVDSSNFALNSSHVGQVHLIVGVHTGTALELYVDGAPVGSPTVFVGFTPIGDATTIGCRSTPGSYDAAATNWRILGVSGGSYVWSAAEISTLWSDVQSTYDIQDVPSKTDRTWSVARAAIGAPSVWPSSTGTEDMIEAGSVSYFAFDPVFGS